MADKHKTHFDFQGHRGCRGLFPENTVAGFLHALTLGVTTLEMDVVITKDHQVICSHEPWFSHEIALDENGNEIEEADEKNHCIYAMPFSIVNKYDVGLKYHPRFPEQKKVAATKPLLKNVIDSCEAFCVTHKRELPYYNIETKSTPEGDDIFHPNPGMFSDLLMDIILSCGIEDRVIIQSFDNRTLKYIHKKWPAIKLSLLVENAVNIKHHLTDLGFTPDIYSPDFTLVNQELVAFCHHMQMKIIPWTVNDEIEMKKLIKLGVDGLISDYPQKFKSL